MPEGSVIPGKKSAVDRLLVLFSDVRAGEGFTALLLMINLFLLLTAYLIIKTVREALILSEGGAVVKSYAAAAQALLLLVVVPSYGYVASRVHRIKLINGVTLFFISNLVLFYLLGQLRVPLDVPFFLWVGIFNLLIVAQFWSFANDLYLEEQGKRLFPIIAFGGSFGAILGPKIAGWLFEPSGPYGLMLMTALLLGFCMVFSNRVNRRAAHERRNAQRALDPETLGPTRRIQTGPRPTLSSHHCSDDDRCESSQHDGRVHSRPESHGGSETTRGGRDREPGRS